MKSTSSPKNGLPSGSAQCCSARDFCNRKYLSGAMRRPLRSKRAMISPVSPRAKASGLTRIRVRSMAGSLVSELAGLDGLLVVLVLLVSRGATAAARLQRLGDLGLAVRAHGPLRLE